MFKIQIDIYDIFTYPYESINDIGPILLIRSVPYKNESADLYNIMNYGHVIITDQDRNILDIFPFKFGEDKTDIND